MKLRNMLAALGLVAASTLAFATPSSAVVTSHCFNHSISGEFICHFYENGGLIAVAGGGGVYWLHPFYQFY